MTNNIFKKFKYYKYKEMIVNTADIIIPAEYQRRLDPEKIKRIAAEFNWLISNPPKLSYRDGKFICCNGQHTIGSFKRLNNGEDLPIVCKVYEGLTKEEEAMMFAQQDGISTPLPAGVKLRAESASKDTEALAFISATESAGLQISYDGCRVPWKIVCIRTAFKAYKEYGAELYKEALSLLVDAWEGAPDSLRAGMLQGMMNFVSLYRGEYDHVRMVRMLRRTNPKDILQNGEAMNGTASYRYMSQILRVYNGSSRMRSLPVKA